MTEPKANIIVFRYFPEIILYSISDTIIWLFPVGYSRHITVVANENIYPLILQVLPGIEVEERTKQISKHILYLIIWFSVNEVRTFHAICSMR